jgi:RHS repeat-associated protein
MLTLQERNAANTVLVMYTRGLDLGGTRQGAGGIGGLLAHTDGSGSTYYHADAAGNITAMADASGNVVARYLYDPFGNLLGKWGALADTNRYRFSSKEVHPNSGLYYYGYRFYEPNLQRWMNRDPIGEAGGINLYRAVLNAPGNVFDSDGLSTGNFYAGSSPGFNPSYGVDNAPVNMVFTMDVRRYADGKPLLSDPSTDYGGTDWVLAVAPFQLNPTLGPYFAVIGLTDGLNDATNPNLDTLSRVGGGCRAAGNAILLGLGAKGPLGKCLGKGAADAGTTLDNLSAAAKRSAQSVGPASGPVYGTQVHVAFQAEVEAMNNSALRTEVSYLNGAEVPYGTQGSVRIDVGQYSADGQIQAVFDLKTGSATLTPARIQQIQQAVGSQVPVTIVRP